MEIKLQIGVISRDNSEYCHYAIPENRAQDREKPRKISRIRAWGERGGLAHPKHRLSTRNPSPRAGASGNETRVASVRNPKSRIQNHVSALRRSELGQGHGQAIGARMHGSAPWKTEETIVGLPRLLVLSVFSRFGGCHLSDSRFCGCRFPGSDRSSSRSSSRSPVFGGKG